MNKPYANFQKYRMNQLFKQKFRKIEQNTRLYMYFSPQVKWSFENIKMMSK